MVGFRTFVDAFNSRAAGWKRFGVRHRPVLLVGGMTVFVAGLIWSISALDLAIADLEWRYLPLAMGAVVVAVGVNAAEQWFAAKALKIEYSFGRALQVSCWATLANMLPVPGAIMVRGASFAKAGVPPRDNAVILGAGAVVWVLLATALVAFAALPTITVAGLSAVLVVIALAVSVWLGHRFVPAAALGLLLTRIGLIALTVVRLYALIKLIGGGSALREAAVYAGASLVGQVVGIVPAGLGVVEAVGAGMALIINAAPAEAFVALSLNRALGLGAAGVVVVFAHSSMQRLRFTRKGN